MQISGAQHRPAEPEIPQWYPVICVLTSLVVDTDTPLKYENHRSSDVFDNTSEAPRML